MALFPAKRLTSSRGQLAMMAIAATAIAAVAMAPLVLNPGYFNHDELQKSDEVFQHGLIDYLQRYTSLASAENFGQPVRPLSFAVEGLQAVFIQGSPFIVHASDVLMHLVVSYLVGRVAIQVFSNRCAAFYIGVIFFLSPLSVFAVGWSAALMDRLYLLFSLLSLLAAHRILVVEAVNWRKYLVLLLWASLAVLSKETAIIAPGLLVVEVIVRPSLIRQRRLWLVGFAWALPGFVMLANKLHALSNSFGGHTVAFYSPSVANIPSNILVYWSYPFVPRLWEAMNWIFVPSWQLTLGVAAHTTLAAVIAWSYGWRAVAAYVVAYSLFLFPVVLLPTPGAHWLYGSGLAFAFGLGAIAIRIAERRHLILGVGFVVCSLVLLDHTAESELYIYGLGSCMSRATATLDTAYEAMGAPPTISVKADEGAPSYVLRRLLTGRNQIGSHFPVAMIVLPDDAAPRTPGTMGFNKDCGVYAG